MAYQLETLKKDLLLTQPTLEQMGMDKVEFAKEMEFAIQAFQKNTALLNCKPETVKNCLVNVKLAGTTLSPVMKLAYLVPRKGDCCLDMSFMGLVKLITDTGSAVSITAKIVHENEPFDIELGSGGFVKHTICKNGNRGRRIGAYSIAELHNGSSHVEWMYEDQLMAIKLRAQKTGGAVWVSDEDEMCRKTVIKRHWKQLPKSDRAILAAQAIAFDDDVNGIDFKKEQEEANRAKQNPNATPDAPVGEAYATEEDFHEIFKILDEGKIGNPFLAKGFEALTVENLRKQFVKHQEAGTLLKDKFETYYSWFKWEEQEVDKLANQKGGEDVTGQTA